MNKYVFVTHCIAPKAKVEYHKHEDLGYDPVRDLIILSDEIEDGLDCGFMRHLRHEHDCTFTYNYSLRLWTILHELGHHFTDVTESVEECIKRAVCGMFNIDDVMTSRNMCNLYYDLPNEWNATEWAINWIKNHRIAADLLNRIVKEV